MANKRWGIFRSLKGGTRNSPFGETEICLLAASKGETRKSYHPLVVKYFGWTNLSSGETTRRRNENASIGPMTNIAELLRNAEQQIYDFNTPWSMAIIVLGFLCAWAVNDLLERLGLTRHVWHLPLFFAALAVLFGSLIGLFFAP